MKKQLLQLKNALLLLTFVLTVNNFKAQSFSCNLSNYDSVNVTNSKFRYYYSGTQSVSPIGTNSMAITVCGNGTMVYDTTSPIRTNYVLVYAGATYIYMRNGVSYPSIHIKNGGTLIIKGNFGYAGQIYTEPTATIINQSTVAVSSSTCATIVTPTNSPCNGTSTAVPDLTSNKDQFNVFPNPCNQELNINFGNYINDYIEIYNVLGTLVKSQPITGNSAKISLIDLSSGMYFVSTRNTKMQVKKIYVVN